MGKGRRHWHYFKECEQEGVWSDSISFVGVLNACLNMVVLEDSRCAHEQIIESRWDSKEFVGSSLVDMYTQGGGREEAWRVFHKMPSRNVVFWNSLLRMCHAWAW